MLRTNSTTAFSIAALLTSTNYPPNAHSSCSYGTCALMHVSHCSLYSKSFSIFSSTPFLSALGCIMPFNNVASALLMERNFFIPLPESSPCTLLYPNSCQNKTNVPVNCPENRPNHVYQLPLPASCTVGSRT